MVKRQGNLLALPSKQPPPEPLTPLGFFAIIYGPLRIPLSDPGIATSGSKLWTSLFAMLGFAAFLPARKAR